MSVAESRRSSGPVTLVVSRKGTQGSAVLTWIFASEAAALCITRAFRRDECWLLLRGAFHNAIEALSAAARPDALLTEAGGLRKCEVPVAASRNRSVA